MSDEPGDLPPEADLGTDEMVDDPPSDFASDYDAEVMAALDAWEPPEYLLERPLPSRLVSWSRSSLMGAVISGMGLALRDVFEPVKDEAIVIEVDADGEPHDLPIQLLLDPDSPAGSLCIVRRDPKPPVV
jgi:hypothetical protein